MHLTNGLHLQTFHNLQNTIQMNTLLHRASTITGYTIEEITGRCRDRQLVMVRHCLIWTLRQYRRMPLNAIGRIFDRDHTSVMHACQKVRDYIECQDEMYLPIHNAIVQGIYSPIRSGKPCAQCTYEISKQLIEI